MSISYLKGHAWSEWTRDERFFCPILYHQAASDVQAFASWLIDTAELPFSKEGAWDLGYEVCFYRHYLWQLGESARAQGFPPKRTFDFCLFGERHVVVIEAKVYQPFSPKQNCEFDQDKERLCKLPGLEHVSTAVVALASSRYFENAKLHGWPETLSGFDGQISWAQVAGRYPHPMLRRANSLYKLKAGAFRGADPA